jgi:exosortase H (IPTLxxWG-CTERM-specific)
MSRVRASRDKVTMEKAGERSPKKDLKILGPRLSIRRFALTYLILMGAFFLLIGLKPIQDIIDLNGLYSKGVVILTSGILETLCISSNYQGSVIKLPSIALDVRFGCNGLEAVMIYAVAVMAFPAPWKNKLMGIVGGFVAIQVINILRIASLAFSAIHFKSLFEYIHIYVAQGLMIAVSLGIFFIYLNYAKSSQQDNI